VEAAKVKVYTKQEVEAVIDGNEAYTLVDVREPAELVHGIIPTAVNIPLQQLPSALRSTPDCFRDNYGVDMPDAGDLLVFYCRSGARSQTAAEFAIEEGWERVGNYRGSAMEWFPNTP
jgi:rhodanese-related sulfurtransferase